VAGPACSCRHGPACDRPAKHPLVRHGLHDATTSPAQLERWWRQWPHANLGLATGIVFDALDVDGPAGLAALRQLQKAATLPLPGPLVATGGGGWHAWFRPTGLGNRPPRGLAHVDWRGRGGCVLAHPANTSPAAATAGCAFKVYRYVARGVLDEREVTLAFTAVALDLGLDHAEIGRTLASARTAGLANPRTIPATPDPSRQEVGP
jgi:hypothetical protein